MTLKLEVIRTSDELAALGAVWDQLVARAGLNHPFVSHDWIRTWWESFGGDAELCIALVRSGDELIAIAPFMRTMERLYGTSSTCLRLLANDHTPRCDFIVAAKHDEAYSAIWNFMMSGDWDMVQLREVPDDSATLQALSERAREAGIKAGTRHTADSPFLRTAPSWTDYMDTLPPKRRWFLRNRLKRLSALGRVSLETVTGGDDLADALEHGFRLEAAAWKGEAGTAIVCEPEIRRFYTLLAERAAAQGWLHLQFLKVDDRRIAFSYCLAYEQRMYLLKTGFDPEYADYSPGNLLSYLVLQDVHASGFREYDFLGSGDHWKRQWAGQTAGQSSLFLYADRPLPRLAHYTKFSLIPAVKQLPFYARLRDRVFGPTT
jgi:CelD/BcsL family acetyltransferase involved in cellulose biosynthesis